MFVRIFPFIEKMNCAYLPHNSRFKDYFSYVSIKYHKCMIHTPELYSGGIKYKSDEKS
jgi:hypothetical protein